MHPYLVDSSSLLCAVCEVDCSAEVTSSRNDTSRSVASTYDFLLCSIWKRGQSTLTFKLLINFLSAAMLENGKIDR